MGLDGAIDAVEVDDELFGSGSLVNLNDRSRLFGGWRRRGDRVLGGSGGRFDVLRNRPNFRFGYLLAALFL